MRDVQRSPLRRLFVSSILWAALAGFMSGLVAPTLTAPARADEPSRQPLEPSGPRGDESLAVFTKTAPESVDDLVQMEQHLLKLIPKVVPCTVGVQIRGVQGSGVIINKEGYVLTAGHVSGEPGREVKIILHDGRTVKGKTLGRNIAIDSGLIKITDKALGPSPRWPRPRTSRPASGA
jgi:serine protease Do